jgi:hemerythrin-like domain-containing protein
MHITDALLGEHGVIYALLDHLERLLPQVETLAEAHQAAGLLKAALGSHATLEDELLFPALEHHLGPMGPLEVMRAEHEEIEDALGESVVATTPEVVVERLSYAMAVAREHFAKEERVLFQMARQMLGDSELTRLADRWADTRKVSL